jgi:hypothetical protein
MGVEVSHEGRLMDGGLGGVNMSDEKIRMTAIVVFLTVKGNLAIKVSAITWIQARTWCSHKVEEQCHDKQHYFSWRYVLQAMRPVVERKRRPLFRWDMEGLVLFIGPIIERIGAERLDR